MILHSEKHIFVLRDYIDKMFPRPVLANKTKLKIHQAATAGIKTRPVFRTRASRYFILRRAEDLLNKIQNRSMSMCSDQLGGGSDDEERIHSDVPVLKDLDTEDRQLSSSERKSAKFKLTSYKVSPRPRYYRKQAKRKVRLIMHSVEIILVNFS